MRGNRPLIVALILATGAGCFLALEDLGPLGRRCQSVEDCPGANYRCVPHPEQPNLSVCELVFPPGTPPSGTQDGGPPPAATYYCGEVASILTKSCVANCHGEDTGGSGITAFRLDYYEATDGGTPGAQATATRIKVRTFDLRTMPPLGFSPMPSDPERALIARWVSSGAPFCDGGQTTQDAGQDAGNGLLPDGGLSFSQHIQPIFRQRCGGGANNCHFMGAPAGGMSLRDLNAHNAVLQSTSGGCNDGGSVRVRPGNPDGSMLWLKISGSTARCRDPMPPSSALIGSDPAAAERIRRWIAQGAPNN